MTVPNEPAGDINFSRFTAYFQVIGHAPVNLPAYAGSTIRGALGHAMRQVRFGMKKTCPDCPIRSECRYGNLYAYLFESPADHPLIQLNAKHFGRTDNSFPQPFVLDPPAGGSYTQDDLMAFDFTLVGRGIRCFPFMTCALDLFGTQGVGKGSGKFALIEIVNGMSSSADDASVIYDGKTKQIVGPAEIIHLQHIREWVQQLQISDADRFRITVTFLTPFRYKNENRFSSELDFHLFLRNVFRRIRLMSVHCETPPVFDYQRLLENAKQVTVAESHLEWHDWQRFSNRQNIKMNLGGVLGHVAFEGKLYEYLPYLKIGEYLNVGKNGSFGLGKYHPRIV